ncbi:MAG: hypothetical protein RL308_1938 [Bacteroidota bacterium]|jgi:hypothetical protein
MNRILTFGFILLNFFGLAQSGENSRTIDSLLIDIKDIIKKKKYLENDIRIDTIGNLRIKYVRCKDTKIGDINLFDRFSSDSSGVNYLDYSSSFSIVEKDRIIKFKGYYYDSFYKEIIVTNLNHIPEYSFAINNKNEIVTTSIYTVLDSQILENVYYLFCTESKVNDLKISEISLELVQLENKPRYTVLLPLSKGITRITCR